MNNQPAEHPSLADSGPRQLTIGMATYDDYDGVYFTVQAIRLYHPEVTKDTEFLIVDNQPDGQASPALRGLSSWVEGYRYLPFDAKTGTAAPRNYVFQKARTPYVLCIDCHVLFAPGALRRLIDYFHGHPDSWDLLQGPMLHDASSGDVSTHFDPVWSDGMCGQWETDHRGVDPDGLPFEIPIQGMGAFACRREAWPGFNPLFRGFGGEEGYLHEKIRQSGGRVLCLPFLRWTHRFDRPGGVPYPNLLEDRIRNYLIGWRELGLDTGPMEAHFRNLLGDGEFEAIRSATMQEIALP